MKVMQVNAEKCVQCGECMTACSKLWFKEDSQALSRVKVETVAGFPNFNICSQCGACIGVCPTEALVRDANGIVHVSAKDLGTGKEQKITIQSDGGMSKEDIDRMVKEAEVHATEDKKQKEAIDVRNQADSFVYQAEKTIKDLGEKADKAQIEKVQAGVEKVKEALKGDDVETIKKALEEAQKPLYEMSAAAYQQAQAAQGAQGAAGAQGEAGQQEAKKADDDVVDAEYTEVKDDKK